MITEQKYTILSLELHLFFGRIMKEHALFLEAGFSPKNADMAQTADQFKQKFEALLDRAVRLSNGIIRDNVLNSGEIITEYTLGSEQKTENFTGIPINKNITMMESNLTSGNNPSVSPAMYQNVKQLNADAKVLLDGIIEFKRNVLNDILSCNIMTGNYPLLVQHILLEAINYRMQVMSLENGEDIDNLDTKETENFWDQRMLEHALFIRGLLDPTENELINTANDFAASYTQLLAKLDQSNGAMLQEITQETLDETIKYRDFKAAGTKGINECKIYSIIQPLLADHVLREANHFIRLLKMRQ